MVDLCLLKCLRFMSQPLLAFIEGVPLFKSRFQSLVQSQKRLKKLLQCNIDNQLVMTPVIRISKGQPCPTSLAPYSGKFFNVHKFHRMPPETLEEIFMLLFSCNVHTTSLPVDVPAPHANLATRRNDEAKKQGRLFVLMYARHMTSSISTLVHFFVFITAKAGWPVKIKNFHYTACMVKGIMCVCNVYRWTCANPLLGQKAFILRHSL